MSEQAAAGVEDVTEAPEEASGSEEEHEFPTFDIDVPPEIQALIDEDDDDLEVTDEDLATFSEQFGEDSDPILLRRLAEAEKQAKHFERLRVQEARKNWAEEAKTYFPLAEPFLDEINATSKRGYLRTAKQINDRMKPIVEEKVLKPAREAMAKTKDEVVAEGKAEVQKAWGTAITSDGSQQAPAVEETQRPRRRMELADTIRAMVFPKES